MNKSREKQWCQGCRREQEAREREGDRQDKDGEAWKENRRSKGSLCSLEEHMGHGCC